MNQKDTRNRAIQYRSVTSDILFDALIFSEKKISFKREVHKTAGEQWGGETGLVRENWNQTEHKKGMGEKAEKQEGNDI